MTKKHLATKHGHGIKADSAQQFEDPLQADYRRYRMSMKHTTKDVVLIVAVTVLVAVISTYLTTRAYGL